MLMEVLRLLQKLLQQVLIEMHFQDGTFFGEVHFTIHLYLIFGIDHLDFIHGQDLVGA